VSVIDVALDGRANMCSMPTYSFVVTEHDPERPWIVRGQDRETVTLDDSASFWTWAHERWPAPRWSVELDPWQLAPEWAGTPPKLPG
jgi:hypothetical protein